MKILRFGMFAIATLLVNACGETDMNAARPEQRLGRVEVSPITVERLSSGHMRFAYSIYNPYDISVCVPRWNAIYTTNLDESRATVIQVQDSVNERFGIVEIAPYERFQRVYIINPSAIRAPDFLIPEPAFGNQNTELTQYQENFLKDLHAPLAGRASEYIMLCDDISEPNSYSPPNSPYLPYNNAVSWDVLETETKEPFTILP